MKTPGSTKKILALQHLSAVLRDINTYFTNVDMVKPIDIEFEADMNLHLSHNLEIINELNILTKRIGGKIDTQRINTAGWIGLIEGIENTQSQRELFFKTRAYVLGRYKEYLSKMDSGKVYDILTSHTIRLESAPSYSNQKMAS